MDSRTTGNKQVIYEVAAQKMDSLVEKCDRELLKTEEPRKVPLVYICLVLGILACALIYVPLYIRTGDSWFLFSGAIKSLMYVLAVFLTNKVIDMMQIRANQKVFSRVLPEYIREERKIRVEVHQKLMQEDVTKS